MMPDSMPVQIPVQPEMATHVVILHQTTVNPAIEGIILFLVLVGVCICFYLIKKFGHGSLTLPFTYFGVGTLLLGVMRTFVFLESLEIINLQNVTFEIWWHAIFYLSMITFILGGIKLDELATKPVSAGFAAKDKYILLVLFAAALFVLFIGQPLEKSLGVILAESLIYKLGLHHFLSFILAFIAAFYTYRIKGSWSKFLTSSIYPFLGFLSLMTLQHFWALLNHTWRILHFEMEAVAQVEQFIVIVALLFLNLGFLSTALSFQNKEQVV